MITKITGQLVALQDNTLSLKIDALEYEILIPEFTRRNLQHEIGHLDGELYVDRARDVRPAVTEEEVEAAEGGVPHADEAVRAQAH